MDSGEHGLPRLSFSLVWDSSDKIQGGDAWNFFTHDHARSRAYRWGEDGIAGLSDDKQRLCFALGLWNGKDPILKERFPIGVRSGFPLRCFLIY